MTYWLMFIVPAFMAAMVATAPRNKPMALDLGWLVTGVTLALLVGLRTEVGGDWFNYENHFTIMQGSTFEEALERKDPGYYVLIWVVQELGGSSYLVNLVLGALFSFGLMTFCSHQPRPWLALAVSVPYLVLVVGMGYARQGTALGLAMMGLVALAQHKNLQFVLLIGLAATFHKSAVLLVPMAILATPRGRIWTTMWVGVASVALYWTLLADSVDNLVTNYIDAGYQSEGAAIRVAMNALPAVLLLLLRRKFQWKAAEKNLWTMMALAAVASVVFLVVSPSSTAVDRVALYLIPLQLYVFSRLPDLVGVRSQRRWWVEAVIGFYALVLFVWLNFATHAQYWLPYRSHLWESL